MQHANGNSASSAAAAFDSYPHLKPAAAERARILRRRRRLDSQLHLRERESTVSNPKQKASFCGHKAQEASVSCFGFCAVRCLPCLLPCYCRPALPSRSACAVRLVSATAGPMRFGFPAGPGDEPIIMTGGSSSSLFLSCEDAGAGAECGGRSSVSERWTTGHA